MESFCSRIPHVAVQIFQQLNRTVDAKEVTLFSVEEVGMEVEVVIEVELVMEVADFKPFEESNILNDLNFYVY